MKKILTLSLILFLGSACSTTSVKQSIKNILPQDSTETLLRQKIDANTQTISMGEVIGYDWEYIRFIRPYQTKKIYGETLTVEGTDTCRWVIMGKNDANEDTILDQFTIERELLDCVDLPDKVFSKSAAIFLVREGKLQERKKFKRGDN